MTALWLTFLFLLLAALLCLVAPLLRKTAAAATGAAEDGLRDFYLARREQLRLDAAGGAPDLAAEEELQRELLHDLALRRSAQPALGRPGGQRAALATACLLSVTVPLAAAALYGKLGNPRAAASAAQVAAPQPHEAGAGDDMALAVNALAQRLRAAPGDADGWYMLARSYETLGRYGDAVAAYREVLRLYPGQPSVLADMADALLSANQGTPDAASIAAVAQALAAEPDHPKALALAGMMALRRGDAAEALGYWERLRPLLPPDSEAARQIESNIAQARSLAATAGPARATMAAPAPASGPTPGPASASAPERISGQARIADALRARVQPGDTVFILARAMDGPRMPLAVLRLRVSDLPRAFSLDDSLAMSPAARLSAAGGKVRVEIRVSRDGLAAAQPGDVAGALSDVAPGSAGLDLVADTIAP